MALTVAALVAFGPLCVNLTLDGVTDPDLWLFEMQLMSMMGSFFISCRKFLKKVQMSHRVLVLN
uniref:Uncharacterized protein n=1 Tax=Anguilla anguilla TaxID=7936 RepID=A0A0E9WTZ9_ANGAN